VLKRLDRYLLRESLPPFLFGLFLYSGLVVMSANFPRLQWIIGTPFWGLIYWLVLQFPAAVVQTLPIALLLAVLLSFGQLAAANELLAVQAGGVALRRLGALMLTFGLLAAGFALAMNQWVLPRTNVQVGSLWWQLTSSGSGLFRLARQSLPLGDYTLSFDTVTEDDELWGVRLESWRGRELSVVLAERARFTEAGLTLYDYQTARLNLGALAEGAPGGTEQVLENLVLLNNPAAAPDAPLTLRLAEDPDALVTRYSGGGFEDARSISEVRRDAGDVRLSPPRAPRRRRPLSPQARRAVCEPHAAGRRAAPGRAVRPEPQRRLRVVAVGHARLVSAADHRAASGAGRGAAGVAGRVVRQRAAARRRPLPALRADELEVTAMSEEP